MSKAHKWQFVARFRTGAFGRRASRLAAQRLKEAVSEKLSLAAPCEPRTLNRAAKDLLAEKPSAALAIAMSSLRWLCEGAAYELSGIDAYSACASAMKAADRRWPRAQGRSLRLQVV
jgi:hypothetical protein